MVLLINKEVDGKEIFSWYIIAMLNQKVYGSRNQPAQSPLMSIELPKLTRSNRKLDIQQSKGKERSHIEGSRTGQEAEWMISINDKLQQASHDDAACSWAKLCIYRVPQCLRDAGDGKAYIPQIVSLGPYHHAKKPLRHMERHKWRALHHILKRNEQRIDLYLDAVKELEEQARSCYEGTISFSSNEFAEMMVLDSCFMLELFQGPAGGFTLLGYSGDDPIFAMPDKWHLIQRDMLMLENQIPLFILDKLLSLQNNKPYQTGDVIRLALRFLNLFTPTDEPPREEELNNLELSIGQASNFDSLMDLRGLHCLDVFRRNLLTVGNEPSPRIRSHKDCDANKRRPQLIHCVTELKEAGIKFKRRNTDRFWDIKFKNGVLEIPRLLIQDGTKSLLLNLIAYEQSHPKCTSEITSYAIFMDSLINTAADVSYLHYKGIVENWLGNDDDVAELFNRLCQEVSFDVNDSYLSKLSGEVIEHYDHKWHAWKASLRHKYFNSPWAIISFLAAVMLLLLTSLQTFFTVFPYFKPHS